MGLIGFMYHSILCVENIVLLIDLCASIDLTYLFTNVFFIYKYI